MVRGLIGTENAIFFFMGFPGCKVLAGAKQTKKLRNDCKVV